MPNWCVDDLVVEGPEDEIKRFREQAHEEEPNPKREGELVDINVLSFNKFIPMPEELRQQPDYGSSTLTKEKKALNQEKYGSETGYDWECKNWGVKWGAAEADLEEASSTLLSYHFETPWGPALEAHDRIAKMYPLLKFTLAYDEPGCDFSGTIVWENGERSSEEEGSSRINVQFAEEEESQREDEREEWANRIVAGTEVKVFLPEPSED